MIITIGTEVKDSAGLHYQLDEAIGSGGFGIVYKAHCTENRKTVAVKVLQNTFNSQDAFLTFQKEANQASLVESENVIRYLYVHDGSEFSEYPPYIIMEYTNDGTLRDVIERQQGKQFDIRTLIKILLQLAHGMKCVNSRLVHRDIKPENILNFHGIFKITDFGLSKIAGENTKSLTFKNGGTPLYIAPEAWNNDHNTIQMDIYSMGIVFFELATLSYPYQLPTNGAIYNLRDMHLFTPPTNPASINSSLPAKVVSIILRMMEKPTQKRFTNWDEIIEALSVETSPEDNLSGIVEMALSNRNQKDIQQQAERAEKTKAEEIRTHHIKMAYAQYTNTILQPIRDFIGCFNSQYSQSERLSIKETEPTSYSPKFVTRIQLPSHNDITISGEILFKEQFTRTEQSFFDDVPRQVHYIPQCEGKEIILWCQVEALDHLGFNLLLLKSNDGLYGDWYLMECSSSGLARNNRISPFGFTLSELPKEINYVRTLHIYNMHLRTYDQESILKFIAERV